MLSAEGLEYTDENGETKLIPRCDEQDKYCYKYTPEELSEKQRLCRTIAMDYPDLCRGMIEIMVDSWMNHPEKMEEAMRKDTKFTKKFLINS